MLQSRTVVAPHVLAISPSRWLWAVGMDVLLLAMLWWEYTQPLATPLALGWGLAVFATMKAWLYVGRTLWLRWKVRKVFGRSIDHLQVPVLPLAYRLTSMVGDVLITAMLAGTGMPWLALCYGLAAVGVQALHHPYLLFSPR